LGGIKMIIVGHIMWLSNVAMATLTAGHIDIRHFRIIHTQVDLYCILFYGFQVFKELFDAVINEKHGGFGPDAKHPPPDLDSTKVIRFHPSSN
jgi:hypothetical protein